MVQAAEIVHEKRRSLRPLADALIEITKQEGVHISEAVKMVKERRLSW